MPYLIAIRPIRSVSNVIELNVIYIQMHSLLADHELIESEDHVEVNGITFNKPFVEKPVSAEDHNIYIYYPTSAGGGSQRLFRKIGSRSSVYSPESRVRKTGSFIYEDFMPTDGMLSHSLYISLYISLSMQSAYNSGHCSLSL